MMAVGREADAQAILATVRDDRGNSDYGVLAALREAQIARDAGDVEMAIALYDGLADSSGADRFVRDIAALAAATTLIDSGLGDDGVARLDALIENESGVSAVAREHKAHYLYAQGQHDAARGLFRELAEDEESGAVGIRARQVLAIVDRNSGV